MLRFSYLLILFLVGPQLSSCGNIQGVGDSMVTKDFEFTSGSKKLSGVIDLPENGKAKALILFVHGSGPTDIRGENRYIDLRRKFVGLGIACAVWDKPGNGRSEGQFDGNQPVEESAQEVLDAIEYLRSQNIPGATNIGIWATSRGGWIAPIALAKDRKINFWISVSGVPAMDNKYYLMQSNLPLDGYTREETQLLLDEWVNGKKIFMEGGDYRDYLNATQNIRTDTTVAYYAGDLGISRDEYYKEQADFLRVKNQYEFEPETVSLIMVPDFDSMLSSLNIDVLALFGENDTNVDWLKTKQLYESTLGNNPNASLSIRTFPNANHSLTISQTGSVREVEGNLMREGEKAEGFYRVQLDWLRRYVLTDE